jgi:hypothetical protein
VEEGGEKEFRLLNIRQLIGEYSAVVEMRRKRRDVVRAYQYSATALWRGRDEEEEERRSTGLPISGNCIGEYSAVVEMRRKWRNVVQASQYSATALTIDSADKESER